MIMFSDRTYFEKFEKWRSKYGIMKIDENLILESLTHPSYKGKDPSAEDYERLEFLGDAVLDLVVAEKLFLESKADEGRLTEERINMVKNSKLAILFDEFEFSQIIRIPLKYNPSQKDKASFIEAFFGALFIDRGYEACKKTWNLMQDYIKTHRKDKNKEFPPNKKEDSNILFLKKYYANLGIVPKNAKNVLQELCQKTNNPLPTYELIKEIGPDHDKQFIVRVTAQIRIGNQNNTFTAIGTGKSKKQAELNAAKKLCDKIYLPYY
ncbi:MAG: ribonuclease III family protein [Promethearchaeota archaeon]